MMCTSRSCAAEMIRLLVGAYGTTTLLRSAGSSSFARSAAFARLEPHHRGDELLGVAQGSWIQGAAAFAASIGRIDEAAAGQRHRREADREQRGVQDLERLGRAHLVLEHDGELAAQRIVVDEARAGRARHRLDDHRAPRRES